MNGVGFFFHPSFKSNKSNVFIKRKDDLIVINEGVDSLLVNAPDAIKDKVKNVARDVARDVVGDIARDIARDVAGDIVRDIARDIVGDVAGDIARDIVSAAEKNTVKALTKDTKQFINEKLGRVLVHCLKPKQRKEILTEIELVNNVKNYDKYVAPLLQMGWITMTIPEKPTSPKQQYSTTLKGNIVWLLLNNEESGG